MGQVYQNTLMMQNISSCSCFSKCTDLDVIAGKIKKKEKENQKFFIQPSYTTL